MARTLLTLGALTFLAGCGVCDCFSSNDDMPAGQPFTYNGNAWRVSDDRAAGRLQISAVDPRLTGMGTIADQRHLVSAMPASEFRAAAKGWFATTGRFCTPDQGTAADLGVYQYSYTCWTPV
ncbi:MAG TPA: hypothetical protein VG867_07975 [Rhizomicrobium sp.]|nr:hypothetical protein [Rhizomicrobium sp.]